MAVAGFPRLVAQVARVVAGLHGLLVALAVHQLQELALDSPEETHLCIRENKLWVAQVEVERVAPASHPQSLVASMELRAVQVGLE